MLKRLRALLRLGGTQKVTPSAAPAVIETRTVSHPIPDGLLDADGVKIIRRLQRYEHPAYFVGGCVRDLLVGGKPKDFDIGTAATPRQVKRLFRNSRIIGRRFKLAHVYFQNRKIIEVATFRANDTPDAAPQDDEDLLIRDDNVFGTIEEDARRRDFTINALFYDPTEQVVIDHVDGLGDLDRRLVRTIGDPDVRFREDPIRILRAIKFAARLDFEIEPLTLASLRRTRVEIPKAATPRILEEINRFCRGGAARRSFELLLETGVFEVILPELAPQFAADPAAWKLLLGLLERMDRRHADGLEATGASILACLTLPLIRRDLGWGDGGAASRPRGTDVRELIDAQLRPVSERLRLPRRDQEVCRLIAMSLFRMVPAENVRRSTRAAVLRRGCIGDVIWILGGLADGLGGAFPEAFRYWSAAAEKAGPPPEEAQEEGRRPRRRRSRGGRGRGRRRGGESTSPADGGTKSDDGDAKPAREPQAPRKDLPSPWDDRYFFAALPSAPKVKADAGDRYGADKSDAAHPESDRDGEDSPAPRRRRRRRRRGRKPQQDT